VTETAPRLPVITGLRLIRLLSGAGGYGDVYLAREESLGREVAVKVLRDLAVDPVARHRFEVEATTMAGLQHPNVVAIHGVGRTRDGRAYIVMAYCPQQTMAERCLGGVLAVPDVLRTAIEVGGALESAHQAGIIHRDVKPANILTLPWGAPGLTDFGVATQLTPPPEVQDDEVGVSIPWSPPEMLFTEARGNVATDVYSYAATIWHLLVGRSPFEIPGSDNSRLAVMGRIRSAKPPQTGRADVPESLERILSRSLAKEASRRHPSVAALAQALMAVEDELHVPRTRIVVTRQDAVRSPDVGAIAETDLTATRLRHPATLPPATSGLSSSLTSGVHHAPSLGGADSSGPALSSSTVSSGRIERLEGSMVEAPKGSASPGVRGSRPIAQKGVLAGVAALAAAAALGAFGYRLLSANDKPTRPTSTISDEVPPADAGNGAAGLPPGPVTVEGTRDGPMARFDWTYSAADATDTFLWRTDDGRQGTSDKPSLDLATPRNRAVCLEVKVVRRHGTGSAAYSDPGCVST
jgi:serine/threonine protein kinase